MSQFSELVEQLKLKEKQMAKGKTPNFKAKVTKEVYSPKVSGSKVAKKKNIKSNKGK